MAIWGIGVMVGPILGPTLGGWFTSAYSWRWVFYVNLPFGVLAFLGLWVFMAGEEGTEQRHYCVTSMVIVAVADFPLVSVMVAVIGILTGA